MTKLEALEWMYAIEVVWEEAANENDKETADFMSLWFCEVRPYSR